MEARWSQGALCRAALVGLLELVWVRVLELTEQLGLVEHLDPAPICAIKVKGHCKRGAHQHLHPQRQL